MKKVLLLFMAFVMLLASAGCTDNSEKAFKASEMIKNAELWNGKYMFDDEFKFVVEYFNLKSVEAGLGTNYTELGGDFLHNEYSTGEWETFMTYGQGFTDGLMNDLGWQHLTDVPISTKQEALARVLEMLDLLGERKYTSMNCEMPWMHYAGMAGFESLGVEVGAAAESWHFRIAMTRGAAKQYDTPWFVDYSMWQHDSYPNYESGKEGAGGHTLNSTERTMLLAYMMGADVIIAEGGEHLSFCSDGSLSIYGELIKKINEFTKEYSDVGTAYVPFAVIMDKYHGWGTDMYSSMFNVLPCGDFEKDFKNLINEVIYPNTVQRQGPHGEERALSNGRYGDSFDFLLQDASLELLETYPALIMTGDFELTSEEVENYSKYVENGGRIILNTAYVPKMKDFPVELPRTLNGEKYAQIKYGDGEFLVYGKGGYTDLKFNDDGTMEWCEPGDFRFDNLSFILDDIIAETVPFTFSEDVCHTINVKDGTMYVFLANNSGVTKKYQEYAVVDESMAKDITVEYTGEYTLHGVEEVYNHKEVFLEENKATVHLGPGDIAVLEFKIGKQD